MQIGTPEDAKSGLYVAVALATASARHSNWTVADIERSFWPAIISNQCLVGVENDMPVAFVTWGFFDEATATAYGKRERLLKPDDFQSGKEPWVLDLIAPFGHCRQVCGFLRDEVFAGQTVRAFRLRPGGGSAVAKFHGKGAVNG